MKRSPEDQHLEETLRSSKIAAGGFLGHDTRAVDAIIDADIAELDRLGLTPEVLASRMQQITDMARAGLGTTVSVGPCLEASVTEARGRLPCPWPHPGLFRKVVVTVTRTDTGRSVQWSELNIHMIRAHGFFEGRGATFRLEPKALAGILFPPDTA